MTELDLQSCLADMRSRKVWGRLTLTLRDGEVTLVTVEETYRGLDERLLQAMRSSPSKSLLTTPEPRP